MWYQSVGIIYVYSVINIFYTYNKFFILIKAAISTSVSCMTHYDTY